MSAPGLIDAIPYARLLGVRVEEDARGRICTLPFREDLIGNIRLPALHGGVVGAFLELTALVALLAPERRARVPKPINFSVDYLRSAGPQETRCRGEIVKLGRRIANVRVVAWQANEDKPVAAGVGNFLL